MDFISDENLMLKVKQGELSHAGLLFERYQAKVFGYFVNVLNSQQDAEDATQSVFSRLLKYRKSFQEGRAFKTWLFSIAVNQRNQQLTQHISESGNTSYCEEVIDNLEAGQALPGSLSLRDIKKAMYKLSLSERQLISLFIWQGLSHADLAQIYSTKTATMRVKVYRALQQLRALLEHSEN